MKIKYALKQQILFIILILFTILGFSQSSEWISLAPGAGGQIQDLYFDPVEPNRIYLSSDQEGSYRSDNLGNSWTFIGKDLSHGMSFKIRRDNSASGRLYQGGLWGAHFSDNQGTNWTRIEETKGDAIGSMSFSSNNNVIVLGPGWHAKDDQKVQATIIDPIQPLIGQRYVYISKNGGLFQKKQYEPIDGLNHVFNVFVHPTNGNIYVGAASGLYVSNNDGSSWDRIDNPEGTLRGKDGGIKTFTVFKGQEPDPEKYKFSGGISGMAFSPDGERIYVSYQTKAEFGSVKPEFKLFTAKTSNLQATTPQWLLLDGLNASNDDAKTAHWYNPVVDPKSTVNNQRLIIGTNFKENQNRVGLFEGNLTFTNNGNSVAQTWENILQTKLKTSAGEDSFDTGWESAKFLSRAYDFTPASWGPPISKIISGGGNNFFLSNNENQVNWPLVTESWLPIYNDKIDMAENGLGVDTYKNRSFTNTVTYDIATYKNYAIQGNADQGIFESFDNGESWTKKTSPNEAKNVQSVGITKTNPPIVLAEMRNDFGIPSATELFLFARKLSEPVQPINGFDWRLIGGGSNSAQLTNSLPNRQVQCIAIGETNVSRVYLGFRSVDGKGGIYATEDIEAVYDGKSQWAEISNAEMSEEPSFKDIFIDPNDSDVLWASGESLWKGRRSDINQWQWEKYETIIKDLYVWDNNGNTMVALAASVNDAPQEVYVLKNPNAANWNSNANLDKAGLTINKTLTLRNEVWVEQPGETIDFNSLAGYKNNIYVGTENGKHKKGLGLFTTNFSLNGDGSLNLTNGGWKDFTTDTKGLEFYYARTANSDAKIIQEDNGDVNYYLPTFGVGVWKRRIDINSPPLQAIATKSSILLSSGQNAMNTLDVNASSCWSVASIPNWLQINSSSGSNLNGSGNTTLEFKSKTANPDNIARSSEVFLTANGQLSIINVEQLGTPLTINFLNNSINIDGTLESGWNSIPFTNLSSVVQGNASTPVDRFKIGYTSEKLYIAVDAKDDTFNSNFQNGEAYNGDAIVVALDVENDKRESSYGINDFVFKVSRDGHVITVKGNTNNLVDEFAVNSNSNGYITEISIAWEDLGVFPGNQLPLGLEIAVEDNVQGNGVTSILQFASTRDINSSFPAVWGNSLTNGPGIPWLETFDDNFQEATSDIGSTAWSVNTGNLSVDDRSYFKIGLPDNRNRAQRALIARNLNGLTATFSSSVLDISAIAEPIKISLLATEKGNNEQNQGFVKAFYIKNGGAPVLIGEILGDTAQDGAPILFTSDAISPGNSLQLLIEVSNSGGSQFHIIDNILVEKASATDCKKLTDLVVTDIENVLATVSWTDKLGGATSYLSQYRESGGNGIWLEFDPILTDETAAKAGILIRGKTYE